METDFLSLSPGEGGFMRSVVLLSQQRELAFSSVASRNNVCPENI